MELNCPPRHRCHGGGRREHGGQSFCSEFSLEWTRWPGSYHGPRLAAGGAGHLQGVMLAFKMRVCWATLTSLRWPFWAKGRTRRKPRAWGLAPSERGTMWAFNDQVTMPAMPLLLRQDGRTPGSQLRPSQTVDHQCDRGESLPPSGLRRLARKPSHRRVHWRATRSAEHGPRSWATDTLPSAVPRVQSSSLSFSNSYTKYIPIMENYEAEKQAREPRVRAPIQSPSLAGFQHIEFARVL